MKFNITKDLKRDFTEYYNLIYQYKSDCLSASVEYNKKFYSDGSLKPEKSLFFTIKLYLLQNLDRQQILIIR